MAFYMKTSEQSIITRHFMKKFLNVVGMVMRNVSLSGHFIKLSVNTYRMSRTGWKCLETVYLCTPK